MNQYVLYESDKGNWVTVTTYALPYFSLRILLLYRKNGVTYLAFRDLGLAFEPQKYLVFHRNSD